MLDHSVSSSSELTIPIRNIWLLMLYASDFYRYDGQACRQMEENPEEIIELVTNILCHQVETRLAKPLSIGYQLQHAPLHRVRGRIGCLQTIRQRLLEKGRVYCQFEKLSMDTPGHRFVCLALVTAAQQVKMVSLKSRCMRLVRHFQQVGVQIVRCFHHRQIHVSSLVATREDRTMVAAAKLLLSFQLPTEQQGEYHLPLPNKKAVWLRTLFEKAIAGFYRVNLDSEAWHIATGKWFDWHISEQTEGIHHYLPHMKTDIIVTHRPTKQRLVIDTKFTNIVTATRYRQKAFHSPHLYQIYAYLRSQEQFHDPESYTSAGMLLHPVVKGQVNESATIQHHPIHFCTVDLMAAPQRLRQQLLDLLGVSFGWETIKH